MEPILIVGLGNLLRNDDGVGCRVVEELSRRSLPGHVRVVDAGTGGGLTLLGLMEGYSRIYLIDALAAGREPGAIVRFQVSQVRIKEPIRDLGLHGPRVLGAFQLAEALGEHYDPVVFGVQPLDTNYGTLLSAPVQEAAGRLVEMILSEITVEADSSEEKGDDSHD